MTSFDRNSQMLRDRIRCWERANQEMEGMRKSRLAELTEQESARWFDDLSCPPEEIWRSADRRDGSGLVEQQRYFFKARE